MTPTTRLLLLRPHTDAGTAHRAGERIDIDPQTADWLIAIGSAAPAPLDIKPALFTPPLHSQPIPASAEISVVPK